MRADRLSPSRAPSCRTTSHPARYIHRPRRELGGSRAPVSRCRGICTAVDPANTALGHRQVQRWNLPEGWVISKHPEHPALVSEADFIAAQDAAAPRGPAGQAVRRYLLSGLMTCGRCGRRLESAWSNGKPAYRCRHGYTSATGPEHGRPKNIYIREDQILPHLAAMAILLADDGRAGDSGTMQITDRAETACLIDRLRTAGVTLTYDPDSRTIRTGDDSAVAVTAGRNN